MNDSFPGYLYDSKSKSVANGLVIPKTWCGVFNNHLIGF